MFYPLKFVRFSEQINETEKFIFGQNGSTPHPEYYEFK